MRRTVCTVLSFVMLATIAPVYADDSVSVNPSFDFSGVEEFWKVADILKADQEPPAEQWEKLFSTPGYVALVKIEVGNSDIFKKAMRAAFMPSQQSRAMEMVNEAQKKSDVLANYTAYVLAAYRTADINRAALMQRVSALKSYPYAKLAREEAVKFLPAHSIPSLVKVAFMVHHASPDYTPTIIGLTGLGALAEADVKRLNGCGKNEHWLLVLELAQRSFLHFRQQKLSIKYPGYTDRDFPVVRLIDQIAGEGIAAQIDVRQVYFNNGCYADSDRARQLRELQSRQPDVIRELDAFLSTIEPNSDSLGELAMKTNDLLNRSGVPVSFFMADTIIKQMGKEALSTVALNPFEFFLLYNKAAKSQKSAPTFSEKTMKYLKKLEFKYAR